MLGHIRHLSRILTNSDCILSIQTKNLFNHRPLFFNYSIFFSSSLVIFNHNFFLIYNWVIIFLFYIRFKCLYHKIFFCYQHREYICDKMAGNNFLLMYLNKLFKLLKTLPRYYEPKYKQSLVQHLYIMKSESKIQSTFHINKEKIFMKNISFTRIIILSTLLHILKKSLTWNYYFFFIKKYFTLDLGLIRSLFNLEIDMKVNI
mmetsp:Transcript_222/g.305  ORF Transcript_222/g.305 Transcript_222/m.305 type:complete len:203 (-) Transcript_222:26-634(-)